MHGSWEVEKKFHVDNVEALRQRLSQFGFMQGEREQHRDTYFRHPCRDLRATDEAFRLRMVNSEACITYKGPRLKSSSEVKTRTEIELNVDASENEQWRMMLQHLGFAAVPTVEKTRQLYTSLDEAWNSVIVALDCVEQLGDFAEIEILVTDDTQLGAAQATINHLGEQLGLSRPQSRSYLSLLLEHLGVET